MKTIPLLAGGAVLAPLVALVMTGCYPESKPIRVDIVVRADVPAGAAPTFEPAPPPVEVPSAPALEAFSQDLPGTALSFDMIPVEGEGDIGSFWMARTETTWDFYDVFVFELDKDEDGSSGQPDADAVTRPSRPYVAPDLGFGHAGFATISLAYKGAEQYCQWLSLKTGRHYRLPTEAEWKLACERGGITPDTIDAHAWHDGNADYAPHAVGTREPDALGISDLWGNVREWVTGDDGAPVALGGSYVDPPEDVGCDARAVPTPAWQVTDPQVPKSVWWLSDAGFVGFRVVCIPTENAEGADR